MLTGENGSGKSTLLHSIKVAIDGEQVPQYIYRLERDGVENTSSFLFDAELHNPRTQMEYFADQPEMQEFLRTASHGQIMLSLFRETFPKMPDGSILLLDEPEMAFQLPIRAAFLKMLLELVDKKNFRIICATHSPVLVNAKETYVINLDNHTNKNILAGRSGPGRPKHNSVDKCGGHGQIRTADLPLRRRPLYPAELRARCILL